MLQGGGAGEASLSVTTGRRYGICSDRFVFFCVGGVMAVVVGDEGNTRGGRGLKPATTQPPTECFYEIELLVYGER